MTALRSNKKLTTVNRLLWYRDIHRLYGCHPLEAGFGRIKRRHDRRHGMPIENPLVFYARYWGTEARNIGSMVMTYWRLRRILKKIWSDPQRYAYRDLAITPPDDDEMNLSLYTETRGTTESIAKVKRQQDIMRTALDHRKQRALETEDAAPPA